MNTPLHSTRGGLRARTWVGVVALMVAIGTMRAAGAVPAAHGEAAPAVFDAAVCYQLVNETGRKIAWARWELGAPESNVMVRFDDDTPTWIVDLTQRWIEDAYHWQAADDSSRRPGEAGAPELTTHQTIAIWLRRIARQCTELHT